MLLDVSKSMAFGARLSKLDYAKTLGACLTYLVHQQRDRVGLCHMRAVTGPGCKKAGVVTRADLPLHDMTGGNYWMPDEILYQNTQNTLRLGGGLTTVQKDAILAGKARAQQQLNLPASLTVNQAAKTVRITNLTGHKLISGYPEGRRMWLNVKWYDTNKTLLREDGKYDVVASVNGTPVKSIVDLHDPALKPTGWDGLRKPPLPAPEDIVLWELHVRDFSASDASVPAAWRGTFEAFTLPRSNGGRHLTALALAGGTTYV